MIICMKAVSMCLMSVSTERQQVFLLHILQSKGSIVSSVQSICVGRRYSRNGKWHACCPILNMSVNGMSMIFSLTHSTIKGLHCHLLPELIISSSLWLKKQMARSWPHPTNECEPSVNNFWPSIVENPMAVWGHSPIIDIWAAFLGKNASTTSLQCRKNERQQSVNNLWHCILLNPRVVWRDWLIFELLAALLGNNASDIIANMSLKRAAMEHQQFSA